MKKIIITGASGFIGKNLLNYFLNKNFFIYVILKKTKKNIEFSKGKNTHKNFKTLFFKNTNNLCAKLKNLKIDYAIHTATYYVKKHESNDISKIIKSNVLFPTILIDFLCKKKLKKFINFETVWQHYNGKKYYAYNLYASSKQAFNNVLNFYKHKFPKTKFYNLLITDTFGENDKRKKLIPTILQNYKKEVETRISKNLSINLINVKHISSIVENFLNKKIKPDTYVLKDEKKIKIFNLLNYLNSKLTKKIKINWTKDKIANEKIINFKKIYLKKKDTKKEILDLFYENI
jgi:nucleoside-diphosphate-sugar epimerase